MSGESVTADTGRLNVLLSAASRRLSRSNESLRQFRQELRGLLLEVLDAAFAAELDLLPLVHAHDRRAHGTELFARDDAGFQGVRLGVGLRRDGVSVAGVAPAPSPPPALSWS